MGSFMRGLRILVCYAFGEGVEKDSVEAVAWYRKAAEQGHPGTQTKLGWCYHKGTGVDQDPKAAETETPHQN